MMLIATPYRDFEVRDRSPPKVISEVRKTYLNSAAINQRPKLTDDALPTIQTVSKINDTSSTTKYSEDIETNFTNNITVLDADVNFPNTTKIPANDSNVFENPRDESFADFSLIAELLVKCNTDKIWYPRRVQVRGGQLQVFSVPGETGPSSLRLPLRHLSLRAGPLPHSLAICRGQNIVLTLQTANEKAFDQWVKTLAIELIRQTPLDAIKYLDILTLAECWTRRNDDYTKDWNFNNVVETETPCMSCEKQRDIRVPESKYEKRVSTEPKDTFSRDCAGKIRAKNELKSAPTSRNPEEVVESLLKKCQNVETYVPVKEKLFLFESLCKMGRKVRSSEDVSLKPETSATKRAKSCHDLSNLSTHIAVRDICKYFEDRGSGEDNKTPKQSFSGGLRSSRFQQMLAA